MCVIALYVRITELKEYYPTRTEHEIFKRHAKTIVEAHVISGKRPGPLNVVELGAGDGRKTCVILQALLHAAVDFEYIPVDISRQAMGELFATMGTRFANTSLRIHGIVGDYLEAVQHLAEIHPTRRTLVLFIGSSIGNFGSEDAVAFLKKLRCKLRTGDMLLLGCDLKKKPETMRRAYSDAHGVTRDFNLNLLTRMNRELGATFDVDMFEHLAVYNPVVGAMQSYLLARHAHTVTMDRGEDDSCVRSDVLGARNRHRAPHAFSFKKGEPIFTECSFKYTADGVHEMLSAAGFCPEHDYFDKKQWFVDAVATIKDVV